jgi:hypothetical protein
MNPESHDFHAWAGLSARGAAQLRPGFADAVLREARRRILDEPSFAKQLALSAATAALCVAAVAIVDARRPASVSDRNLAAWQQIAAASEDLTQAQ